ncbi:DNA methylase family [Pseudomonas viridiflava]|uniref:site-specific DNA-methyltransferase (adenine-specific) n=1 Tax=Pseudomonas viridiflava TaxID=33069 RepID=A0A1Y6JFZ7_PSEVI|nr:N-6 DNA methylase [Pseudomonas viridiflava]SMS07981.1 DNA methylase family [Pseudomonas viridiflava]
MNTINSGSDILGRYYTRNEISSFLVEQFDITCPVRLLDLGAGSGSLSGAARNRWPDIKVLTVDIDPEVGLLDNSTRQALDRLSHEHFVIDALCENLSTVLNCTNAPIDVAVCNPPFITPKWRDEFSAILKDAGFLDCLPFPSDVDAGLLFLAQNLRLMSENATLGIILPDSLITASKYRKFRATLLSTYAIAKVIQLPRGSFHHTDALASIVILQKTKSHQETIRIHCLSKNKKLSEPLFIDVHAAIERLDYSFHFHRLHLVDLVFRQKSALNELAVEIKRGSLSSSQIKKSGFPVLHITDIKEGDIGQWVDFRSFDTESAGNCSAIVKAQPGDILVSRVGRNLENKIVGVKSGVFPVSDCVYVIRCLPKVRDAVLVQMASCEGRAWISAHAYGVAAKQLAKKELITFPVFLDEHKDV